MYNLGKIFVTGFRDLVDCWCRVLISGEGRLGAGVCVHPNLRHLSLTSFGLSQENSYAKFVVVYTKFRFTCGESSLY